MADVPPPPPDDGLYDGLDGPPPQAEEDVQRAIEQSLQPHHLPEEKFLGSRRLARLKNWALRR